MHLFGSNFALRNSLSRVKQVNMFPANTVGLVSNMILGLTEEQAQAVSNNGWENLEDFHGYTTKDIYTWATTMARTQRQGVGLFVPPQAGITFSSVKTRRLCALNYWVNRRILRGVPCLVPEFTVVEMRKAVIEYPILDMLKETDATVDKPDSFKYEKWVEWHEQFITYLKGMLNITKAIPLYYIIRPDSAPALPSEEEQIIFNASLTGTGYKLDNTKVHQILTKLTTGTDAAQWIKDFARNQDGRGAWRNLFSQ